MFNIRIQERARQYIKDHGHEITIKCVLIGKC